MLGHFPAPLDTAAALNTKYVQQAAPSPRIARVTIHQITFESTGPADPGSLWWRALDLCVIPAEQRAYAHFGSSNKDDVQTALATIDVEFPWKRPANTSILCPLTTDYPMLVRSLRVLTIVNNDYDESAALGAFAALATQLQELSFLFCGLTSVRGLEGRCEYLRKLNVGGCSQLSSLDGVGGQVYLEGVTASHTTIKSIEPLRTCPALAKVFLSGCEQLSSIEALDGHQWLQEVDTSDTGVTSIEPLRSCPALTKVCLRNCSQLASVEALAGHRWLQEVDASHTDIPSIEPLRSCFALKTVNLNGCRLLSSDASLPISVSVVRDW